MTDKTFTLASLDARKASETPFEFEYILPDGTGSGLFLSVYGGQSDIVRSAISKLMNERRTQDAKATFIAQRTNKAAPIVTVESDVEFGHKTAACRLAGWRGMVEEGKPDTPLAFTPELGHQLCASNREIELQIVENSDAMANFMKA